MTGTHPCRHRAPADEDVVGDTHCSPRNELERHAHGVALQLEPWPRGATTAPDIHEPRPQVRAGLRSGRRSKDERPRAAVGEPRACALAELTGLERLPIAFRSVRTVGEHARSRLHVRVPERRLGFPRRTPRREVPLDPERTNRMELRPCAAAGEVLAVPDPRSVRLNAIPLLG